MLLRVHALLFQRSNRVCCTCNTRQMCLLRSRPPHLTHMPATLWQHGRVSDPVYEAVSPLMLRPHPFPHSISLTLLCPPPNYTMPTTCTGSSRDNAPCVCTLFVAKKSKGSRCKTCRHRLTSHVEAPAQQNIEGTVTRGAEGVYVNRLFKSLGATAVHEAARKETLEGFRPPSTQDKVRIIY
jgi:hypothetical protein